MIEPGRRALELLDLMKASPGQRVVSDLEGLSLSTYTFEGNFADFNELLEALLRPEMGIQLAALSNQELLQEAQAEVAKHLHNFVAAATSLIDHTRIISGRLYDGAPERRAAYQQKVDGTFATDPLSRFIVGLRQYCLHYRLPFIGFVFQLAPKQDEPSHAFSLSQSALLEFDGWSQLAKQFIEESEDRIDFISAIRSYRDKVLAFYDWFESDIRELRSPELEELWQHEREYTLIELESQVAMAEGLPAQSPARSVLNIFVQLLPRDELEELSGLSTPLEQMNRGIELLVARLPVPEELIERLRALV